MHGAAGLAVCGWKSEGQQLAFKFRHRGRHVGRGLRRGGQEVPRAGQDAGVSVHLQECGLPGVQWVHLAGQGCLPHGQGAELRGCWKRQVRADGQEQRSGHPDMRFHQPYDCP